MLSQVGSDFDAWDWLRCISGWKSSLLWVGLSSVRLTIVGSSVWVNELMVTIVSTITSMFPAKMIL